MENECTTHIFGSFPILLPKIIKIGGNLTKFWQKQICLVFWDTVYCAYAYTTCGKNAARDGWRFLHDEWPAASYAETAQDMAFSVMNEEVDLTDHVAMSDGHLSIICRITWIHITVWVQRYIDSLLYVRQLVASATRRCVVTEGTRDAPSLEILSAGEKMYEDRIRKDLRVAKRECKSKSSIMYDAVRLTTHHFILLACNNNVC